MFAAYFDLSHGNSPVVSLAGYASTVSQWIEFSRLWQQAINKAGISCFHMTDFVGRFPPFDKLNDSQRKRLMQRLTRLIHRYAPISFDVSLLKSDYDEVFLDHHKSAMRSHYTILALQGIYQVRQWAESQGNKEAIPLFFDRGDRYSGYFKEAYDYWEKREATFGKDFALGSFTLGNKCKEIPLQAADVFAYETWRYRSTILRTPDEKMREVYKYLLKCPTYSTFLNKSMLNRAVELWPDES